MWNFFYNPLFWLFIGGLVVFLISLIFEFTAEPDDKGKHWTSSATGLIAGILLGIFLGAEFFPQLSLRQIAGRMPNTTGVVWKDDVITFPPTTEQGVQWGIVSADHPNGDPISGLSYPVSENEMKESIQVYLLYPDGNNSGSVTIKRASS